MGLYFHMISFYNHWLTLIQFVQESFVNLYLESFSRFHCSDLPSNFPILYLRIIFDLLGTVRSARKHGSKIVSFSPLKIKFVAVECLWTQMNFFPLNIWFASAFQFVFLLHNFPLYILKVCSLDFLKNFISIQILNRRYPS